MNRIYTIIFVLLISTANTFAKKYQLYIGTYTNGESKGIYHYVFDSNTGTLNYKTVTEGIKNPSFLKISPDKKYLYSVAEGDSFNGKKGGGVAAYKIETDTKLTFLNDALSMGAYPCHVAISPDGKTVIASNYGGGNLAVYNVFNDGKLTPIKQLIQLEGSGGDKTRQATPHTHSALFSKKGTHFFAADLGIDKLMCYKPDIDKNTFVANDQPYIEMEPGAGPRHFKLTKNEKFIYVINELNSTVSVLKNKNDEYIKIQDISTLPADFSGESYCADIHISPDEQFVYGSNRGHNSIAIFKRNTESGELTFIGTESVRGDWPRNFNIEPSGNFLLVANQKSNNITVFKIDTKSGKLSFTGTDVKVPNPVCLEFLVQ